MKSKIPLLILFLMPVTTDGSSFSATQDLHPDLIPVYEKLNSDKHSPQLIDTPLNLTLKLKHASEKYLLFHGTQIIIDEKTKYYLIKWKFSPRDIAPFVGKANVMCRVKGRIIEVVKGPTTPGMPYVVVELLNVDL